MRWMVLGVLGLGMAGAGHATLLVNGDLEAPAGDPTLPADGWQLIEPTVDSGGVAVDSASFQGFANHTVGGGRGLWWRSFAGNGDPASVDADLVQSVAGLPGGDYALSAWFRFEANYSGIDPAAPTQTLLALDFYDGLNFLSSVELDIDTVYDTSAGGINTWQQFGVNGVAPPGTNIVRARASMVAGVLSPANPQSAFVDDFELLGPVPTPLVIPTLSEAAAALFALLLASLAVGRLTRQRRTAA